MTKRIKNSKHKVQSKKTLHYDFVFGLVKKYCVNVQYKRFNDWCDQFKNKKGEDKKAQRLLRNKTLMRKYYFLKNGETDIVEYMEFTAGYLAKLRKFALSKDFTEKQKMKFRFDYVKDLISNIKEGAFRDNLVIDMLTKLRQDVHNNKLSLKERKDAKEKLNSFLEELNINEKLTGKKDEKNWSWAPEAYSLIKGAIVRIKKLNNRTLRKRDLKEICPSLSDRDMEDILSEKNYMGARIILGKVTGYTPGTIKNRLSSK
jgi:hypothetical protein